MHGDTSTRIAGTHGVGPGPGLHGDESVVRRGRRGHVDGHAAPGSRARRDVLGHRERLRRHGAGRLRRQREAARAGAGRAPRRGHPRHQDGDRGHQHRRGREHRPAVHLERHARRGAAPLRRVTGPARHRPHRPLLPAPRRPRHPDRGVDRRDGRARAGRQGPPRRCLGGDPPSSRRRHADVTPTSEPSRVPGGDRSRATAGRRRGAWSPRSTPRRRPAWPRSARCRRPGSRRRDRRAA